VWADVLVSHAIQRKSKPQIGRLSFSMQAPPQNTSFVDDYLAALLAQASRLISTEFHEVVRANGFSVNEWRVLASLSGIEGMSVGGLAQVARLVDASDLRITWVRITPEGEKIITSLIKQAKLHEQRVLAPYGDKRAAELKKLLRQIIQTHRRTDPMG
jgi:hypothetical protein